MYNILTTENSNGNDAKIRSFFCVLEALLSRLEIIGPEKARI